MPISYWARLDIDVFMEYSYLVATRCSTYNHASFITDTLNGFAIQRTTFPVIFIIVDDASTDGEQDLLRKWARENLQLDELSNGCQKEMSYGELIFARHKEQQNSTFAILLLAENHGQSKNRAPKWQYYAEWFNDAKYRALCEGDDYWTDPLKLQEQVQFLESNQDYSLVHTHFLFQKGTIKTNDEDLLNRMKSIKKDNSKDLIYAILDSNRYRIQTCTVMYRKSFYDKILPALKSASGLFLMGDTQLWIWLLSVGKIHYFDKITSVYRIVDNSASHGINLEKKLRFAVSCCEMRYYCAKSYNVKQLLFYYRYLKEYLKLLAVNPHYRTDRRIIPHFSERWLVQLISTPLCIKLAKHLFVDDYLRKIQ